jgi:hypothetical protein
MKWTMGFESTTSAMPNIDRKILVKNWRPVIHFCIVVKNWTRSSLRIGIVLAKPVKIEHIYKKGLIA